MILHQWTAFISNLVASCKRESLHKFVILISNPVKHCWKCLLQDSHTSYRHISLYLSVGLSVGKVTIFFAYSLLGKGDWRSLSVRTFLARAGTPWLPHVECSALRSTAWRVGGFGEFHAASTSRPQWRHLAIGDRDRSISHGDEKLGNISHWRDGCRDCETFK